MLHSNLIYTVMFAKFLMVLYCYLSVSVSFQEAVVLCLRLFVVKSVIFLLLTVKLKNNLNAFTMCPSFIY